MLTPYLAGLPLGAWRFFETIGSTNDFALTWAQSGAQDMSLVIADSQSVGRGRFQRHWVTNPGAALAFSLVLRPTASELQFLSHFAALGAIAIWQALAEEWGLAAQIKWPNDILLERKKAAGILIESTWSGSQLQGLVMGIGLNISPEISAAARPVDVSGNLPGKSVGPSGRSLGGLTLYPHQPRKLAAAPGLA